MTISQAFDDAYNEASRKGRLGTAAAIKALREQVEPKMPYAAIDHEELKLMRAEVSRLSEENDRLLDSVDSFSSVTHDGARSDHRPQDCSAVIENLTRKIAEARNLVCGAAEDAHQMWLDALDKVDLVKTYATGETEQETVASVCARIKDDQDALRSQLAAMREALTGAVGYAESIKGIAWGWDGDCGAMARAEDIIDSCNSALASDAGRGFVRLPVAQAYIDWHDVRISLDRLDEFDDPHNYQEAKRRLESAEERVAAAQAELAK